jgi:hypothetical protein
VPLDRFDVVDGFATAGALEVFGYERTWRRRTTEAATTGAAAEGPIDGAAA